MIDGKDSSSPRVHFVWPALFFLTLLAFYVGTIRPQETWIAGDFALYIMHAKNIALGLPYNETMYIHNPANAIISPAAYPPGFPLLLSVAWLLPEQSLFVFKLLNVVFLVGAVFLVYRIALPRLGPRWAMALAVVFGLSPVVFSSRDLILSDIAFLFWCYAALYLYDLVRTSKAPYWCIVGTALSVTMACTTRVAGVALVAALLVTFAIRRGPHWKATATAVIVATLSAFAINRIAQTDAGTYLGYFERLQNTNIAHWILDIALAYGRGIVEIFGASFGRVTNAAIALALVLVALCGFVIRLRREPSATEAFTAIYTTMILAFPVHLEPVRYALPVIPMMMLYILATSAFAAEFAAKRFGRGALVRGVVFGGFLLLYGPFYLTQKELGIPDLAVTDADSQALFHAIDETVPADAVVLARNPRVVGLFTQRHASIWPEKPSHERFWAYAEASRAGYLLQELRVPEPETVALTGIVEQSRDRLTPLFQNDSFVLYRIGPAPRAKLADTTP